MTKLSTCLIAVMTMLPAIHTSAHHSVSVFDTETAVTVIGVITRIEWINPHPVIFVEETLESGQVLIWSVESSTTIQQLERRGIPRGDIHIGEEITACGYHPLRRPASRTDTEQANDQGNWYTFPDRVITGRYLILESGPEIHWSHYGELDLCTNTEQPDTI